MGAVISIETGKEIKPHPNIYSSHPVQAMSDALSRSFLDIVVATPEIMPCPEEFDHRPFSYNLSFDRPKMSVPIACIKTERIKDKNPPIAFHEGYLKLPFKTADGKLYAPKIGDFRAVEKLLFAHLYNTIRNVEKRSNVHIDLRDLQGRQIPIDEIVKNTRQEFIETIRERTMCYDDIFIID